MNWERQKRAKKRSPSKGNFIRVTRGNAFYLASALGYRHGDKVDIYISDDKQSIAIVPGNEFRISNVSISAKSVIETLGVPDKTLLIGEELEINKLKGWKFTIRREEAQK